MRQRYVTDADARLLDALDAMGTDVASFVDEIERAISDRSPHPLTIAAAVVESASFQTPVERGDAAAPTPAEF